ncbi:DUF3558 domain-containing protein [uncultured Mycolicibacterium sp.]|uniref:DUF3558 domain-containing protein n=1 Tax=uncultured Mycolicibacterium sp. TaxID=2320817 RepID=UPI0026260084|nr:DUF3558 domain-containing protein [uncultured Mycolicibacterium sp.]
MAAVLLAAVVATVGGCTRTVTGTAQRGTPEATRDYGYVEDRCGLLLDTTVQQLLGGDEIVRPYSGAVCQYILHRGPDVTDVVYFWFESGDIDRERAVAAERGATLSDTVVERRHAFLARRDAGGAACAATAAAGGGVLSWWVQFRDRHDGDPCAEAEKLLAATLSADM